MGWKVETAGNDYASTVIIGIQFQKNVLSPWIQNIDADAVKFPHYPSLP